MPSKSRSNSESRGRSRSKSVGRPRSRSRGRSKSPARTKSTKAKQSPSPSRKSRSTVTKQVTKTPPAASTRSSTRIKETIEKETQNEVKSDSKELGDMLQVAKLETKPNIEDAKPKQEYLHIGPITAFIAAIALVTLPLVINFLCDKNTCSYKFDKLPVLPKTCSAYYNRNVVLTYLGFLAFQVLLAFIPIGPIVKGPKESGVSIRCNGILTLFLNLVALSGFMYRGYNLKFVHDNFTQFISTALAVSFLVSVLSYICSRKLEASERNEDGNTGCTAYDFIVGRALNPKVRSLDVKFLLHRVGNMSWALMNAMFVYEAYTSNKLSSTLILVALCQGLHIVDRFIFEDGYVNSILVRSHGLGFSFTAFCLALPFLYTLSTRFLLEHPTVSWHPGCLAGFAFLFFIGYVINRGSSSEKNRFRQDPHNTMFANFNKIPSPSGQKLLTSGWWGLCRHPNYIGLILMAFAWTMPCGITGAGLTYVYPFLMVFCAFSGIKLGEKLCEKKHGAAWDRYCREVKYRIIPKVC